MRSTYDSLKLSKKFKAVSASSWRNAPLLLFFIDRDERYRFFTLCCASAAMSAIYMATIAVFMSNWGDLSNDCRPIFGHWIPDSTRGGPLTIDRLVQKALADREWTDNSCCRSLSLNTWFYKTFTAVILLLFIVDNNVGMWQFLYSLIGSNRA